MNSLFLAGAGVRGIMPSSEMVNNALHSCMTVRLDQQGSPLQVKVLAMTLGERTLLLAALDTLRLYKVHSEQMRQSLAKATGVALEDIALCASHSHSTPILEPIGGPCSYFNFVRQQLTEAAVEAFQARRPARMGQAVTYVVGASFNQRVPLPDGGVKFTRDFREGLASGRPIDPRLNLIRIDDERGKPIAGWVRFAAHPACVIFDAPISAEYPGYLTEYLSRNVAGGAPILYAFGAAGDVNCVPMFGKESDARKLGLNLAQLAAPLFEETKTQMPGRMLAGRRVVALPLDVAPSVDQLQEEIHEIRGFISALDRNPELEWVMGINCKKDWPVEKKKSHVIELVEWAERLKAALESGRTFPPSWPAEITAFILDDLGLVFYPGEPFTELGLALAARSPLPETLLMAHANGTEGYLGTDEDRRRRGYETYTWHRYQKRDDACRLLPYALGAGDLMLEAAVGLIEDLI